MAQKMMEISLALSLVSMIFSYHALAQSSSCTTAIVSLAPCLNYISGNSSTPSSSCCSSLASVVSTNAQCLCIVLNGGASQYGLTVNQTQALALPGACNVKTPPLSQCNATAPAQAPGSTPSTPSSTPAATSPTGNGSNNGPTGQSSDGSSYRLNRSMKFSALFLAVFVSSVAL